MFLNVCNAASSCSENKHPSPVPNLVNYCKSPLLYPGSKISQHEAKVLVIGFVSKRSLSDVAVKELLEILNFFLPDGQGISTSTYCLKKKCLVLNQFPQLISIAVDVKTFWRKTIKSNRRNVSLA